METTPNTLATPWQPLEHRNTVMCTVNILSVFELCKRLLENMMNTKWKQRNASLIISIISLVAITMTHLVL